MKIYAATPRDAAELQVLRQKVHDLVRRPQYITVEVEKIVEVPTIVQVVDQMDEHPKVKKSKLSEEDESKLRSRCEQMNQEFKLIADKAEEREQWLEKKIAQLQEDLERLNAENHNLLEANKVLNVNNDMMHEVMKDTMKAMLKKNNCGEGLSILKVGKAIEI